MGKAADWLLTGEPMVPPCAPSFAIVGPFASVRLRSGKARLRRPRALSPGAHWFERLTVTGG
jgi:hypothetical protein